MATTQPALTTELTLELENRIIKLAVTVRGIHDDGFPYSALDTMVATTLRIWCEVYRAIVTDTWQLPEDLVSAEAKASMESSPADPWVTIWNWDKPSLTIHSWDNGTYALATAAHAMAGLDLFTQYAPRLGVKIISTPQFTLAVPKPLAPPHNAVESHPISIAEAFVRSTKLGTAAGVIMLETRVGKSNKTAWVEALRADKRYHHKDIQYPADTLVLFEIEPQAVIGDYEGTRFIEIKERFGGNIRIYDRGGEHNYDWGSLIKHLNIIDTSGLVTGTTVIIPAALMCMKCGAYKDSVQFKNYAGLYSMPLE